MFTQKEELKGTFCPLIKKDCVKERCVWWTQVVGQHPQTGEQLNHFGCAVAWLPVLQIETSQQVRGSQAATESMRNVLASGLEAAEQARLEEKHSRRAG